MINVPTVIGLDAHKNNSTYVVRNGSKIVAGPTTVPSTVASLHALAREYPDTEVVIEACGLHEWMHDVLTEDGMPVFVCHPPRREPGEQKSNAEDADRLARRRLAGDLRPAPVAPLAARRVRDAVRHRAALVEDRTRWINQLKHFLHRHGYHKHHPEAPRSLARLRTGDARDHVTDRYPELDDHFERLDDVEPRIQGMDRELARIARATPPIQRLQSIPGIGTVTGCALYARVWDVERFPNASSLVRYIGVDPEWGGTGDRRWDRHRMSLLGDEYVLGVLNQAAWVHVACAPESTITQGYRALLRRGKPKNKAIGKVMRKLVMAGYWVWKDDRDFTMNRPAHFR